MPTRRIRSAEALDAMQGQVDHVLTPFSGGVDGSSVLEQPPASVSNPGQPACRDVLVIAFTRVNA
ncbi:hypothetical protein [Roseateles sp. BYS96W]|uniref:Uncharacterized protein n=1 Tax=Pelomonas nitida TaxID=3299027 RepID=A0ABW7G6L6_9BURK